jgi:hypothetical protein
MAHKGVEDHEGAVIQNDLTFVDIEETCPHSVQFAGPVRNVWQGHDGDVLGQRFGRYGSCENQYDP